MHQNNINKTAYTNITFVKYVDIDEIVVSYKFSICEKEFDYLNGYKDFKKVYLCLYFF